MQVVCGQCRCVFQVADDQAGEGALCPRCRGRIAVSCPGAAPAPAARTAPPEHPPPGQCEQDFADLARKGIARRIAVVCGSCGNRLLLALRRRGHAVRCSACGKKIHVPDTDEQPLIEVEPSALLEDRDGGRLDLTGGGDGAQGRAAARPAKAPGKSSAVTAGAAAKPGARPPRSARPPAKQQGGPKGRRKAPLAKPRRAPAKRRLPVPGLVTGALAGAAVVWLWFAFRGPAGGPPPASQPASAQSHPAAPAAPKAGAPAPQTPPKDAERAKPQTSRPLVGP